MEELYALTGEVELQAAYTHLVSRLTADGELFERHYVGYPSGHEYVSVYWHPAEHIWFHSDEEKVTRYRCWYGVQNPHKSNQLEISVEVNPPRVSQHMGRHVRRDRQCEGAFARDRTGVVYYMRSGRLGGDRSKQLVEPNLEIHVPSEQKNPVRWPGQWSSSAPKWMIRIGALDDPNLVHLIADFVWLVEIIKEEAEKKLIR